MWILVLYNKTARYSLSANRNFSRLLYRKLDVGKAWDMCFSIMRSFLNSTCTIWQQDLVWKFHLRRICLLLYLHWCCFYRRCDLCHAHFGFIWTTSLLYCTKQTPCVTQHMPLLKYAINRDDFHEIWILFLMVCIHAVRAFSDVSCSLSQTGINPIQAQESSCFVSMLDVDSNSILTLSI